MRWTVSTIRELVHSTHSSSIFAHLTLMRISFLFFVRSVPVWNALSPASVCADSVAAFHSCIYNNIVNSVSVSLTFFFLSSLSML